MIAAGITLHEALKAYDTLKAEGIAVRVIDAYSVKPIDARRCSGRPGTPAASWSWSKITGPRAAWATPCWSLRRHPESTASAVVKLAVRDMPGSGTPAELLAAAGIDAGHHLQAVKCCCSTAARITVRVDGVRP